MSNATETAPTTHPSWCAEADNHAPADHDWHSSFPLHAELGYFSVGASVAVGHCGDDAFDETIDVSLVHREMQQEISFSATPEEVEALIAVLEQQVRNARTYAASREAQA